MVLYENSRMLLRAGVAAAVSPAGRKARGKFEAYGEAVNKESAIAFNPSEEILHTSFDRKITEVIQKEGLSKDAILQLPWTKRRLYSSRIAAGLIAFIDDQGKDIPTELFPVAHIHRYLQSLSREYEQTRQPLTVIDQFDLALSQTNNNPLAASLLAHSAYRSIARSLDSRIHPSLTFPIDSEKPITMLTIARATADFPTDATKRDPLGDTYHFWAQFAGNMAFVLLGKRQPIRKHLYKRAFYFGPQLTYVIRDKALRQPSQFGVHKIVDRQGYRLGTAMGKLILAKQKRT